MSFSAIKDFHSAINQVFALKGQDLAASRELSMLIRPFAISRPPLEIRPTAWDLMLVLRSLKAAPYKPLRSASERLVAQKALFLLALGLWKQIGELHGLSYQLSHTER